MIRFQTSVENWTTYISLKTSPGHCPAGTVSEPIKMEMCTHQRMVRHKNETMKGCGWQHEYKEEAPLIVSDFKRCYVADLLKMFTGEMSHEHGYTQKICTILLVPFYDQRDACGTVHFYHDKCEVIGEYGIPTALLSLDQKEHQVHWWERMAQCGQLFDIN